MTSKNILVCGLSVEIRRKKTIKNIYVRVYPPDGKIIVSSPYNVSDEYLKFVVSKELANIEKARNKIISQNRLPKPKFLSDELHYLWGKAYALQVIFEGSIYKVFTQDSKIIMIVPPNTSIAVREKILTEWYRSELKSALPTFALNCEQKTGIYATEFKIRNMKTRWGTCNISKRRIWINLQLVKMPPECLEYVIIHELVHLLEKNHTKRFYSLLEKFCPEWRNIKKSLIAFPLNF